VTRLDGVVEKIEQMKNSAEKKSAKITLPEWLQIKTLVNGVPMTGTSILTKIIEDLNFSIIGVDPDKVHVYLTIKEHDFYESGIPINLIPSNQITLKVEMALNGRAYVSSLLPNTIYSSGENVPTKIGMEVIVNLDHFLTAAQKIAEIRTVSDDTIIIPIYARDIEEQLQKL